jgi:hypothetical protein
MSEKPISPLRQRMLEDMNMRRFVPDTQREYIRAVKKLASFLGRGVHWRFLFPPNVIRRWWSTLHQVDVAPIVRIGMEIGHAPEA